MALTKFNIISQAMTKIDADEVQSFSDQTREKEVAQTLYDQVKKSELTSYQWNFAINNFILSQEVGDPTDPNWKFKFLKPTNCLAVLNVMDSSGSSVPYRDEGDRILTNHKTAIAKFIADIDEALMPASFVDSLVARLASEFAQPLNGSASLIRNAANEYQLKHRAAARVDAQSNPPRELFSDRASTWLGARDGFGPHYTGNH